MRFRDPYIGRILGNYRVIMKLSYGAYGDVYLALHAYLPRVAAIKLLRATRLNSQEERDRFLREARFLEMLKHPHILPIFDCGIDEEEGIPYVVTEFAPHRSLKDYHDLQPGQPLPLAEAVTILSQVGQGLHHAHQQNIVHRDLKPANILFNANGEALLADFNIAIMQATTHDKHAATATGTPLYRSPEQFQGFATRRSDQYALGCIAYVLVTGHVPFEGSNVGALMHMHMYIRPVPPTQLEPDLPSYIDHAILKALEKEPRDRFNDVQSFVGALQPPASLPVLRSSVPVVARRTKEQWVNEGFRLCEVGRYAEALAANEQAIRLDPAFAPAYDGKGTALYYLRRYEEALFSFESAIRLHPGWAVPYSNKGSTLYQLKRYSEALAMYEQAVRLDATLANAHHGRGMMLYALTRHAEALKAFESAIQLNPNEADFHYYRAKALESLGKSREAERAYERARLLDQR